MKAFCAHLSVPSVWLRLPSLIRIDATPEHLPGHARLGPGFRIGAVCQ